MALIDKFGRQITDLRVSVTDRCDFRCVYCMAEDMHFLPKADLLTLEELDRLCSAFIARGVRKLRLTGGEPLVRRGIMTLFASLSRHLESGHLDELTLTTNGSQLAKYARELKEHGVHRVNVSLDTLDAEKFRAITRWGSLPDVLAGIDAAQAAGLKIKINAVALKGVNEDEIPALIEWAHGRGMDLTLIEVMPLGEIGEGRLDQYLPLSLVRARLSERYSFEDLDYRTGGPARYVRVAETGGVMNEARMRMTRVPAGAELILNKVSAAPGFWIGNVIVMAGVPHIMQVMLDYVAPKLKTGAKMLSDSVRADCREGDIGTELGEIAKKHPDVIIGSYPFMDERGGNTNVVVRSRDQQKLVAAKTAVEAMLKRVRAELAAGQA